MTEPMRPVALQVEHLYKSFDDRQVLVDVNIKLYKGENLVILGRSGMGKSVLIKCIVGLIEPDAGKVTILGKNTAHMDTKALNQIRQKIGFSFQGSALYDSMTVRENLEFALRRNMGIHDHDQLDRLVKEALQDVGLEHAINQMPSELSGGMRKRIGVARSLILKPEIMLYDEPTAGLDPVTSGEINQLIVEVQQKYHTSSIIITHDIACAKATADRIIYMQDGRCHQEGTFEELEHTDDPQLGTFFNYYKIEQR